MHANACKPARGSDAPPARSASEDGRGGAAAPRLDKRTYLDGKGIGAKLPILTGGSGHPAH